MAVKRRQGSAQSVPLKKNHTNSSAIIRINQERRRVSNRGHNPLWKVAVNVMSQESLE
jgi:hypothetical protein